MSDQALARVGVLLVAVVYASVGAVLALLFGMSPARVGAAMVQLVLIAAVAVIVVAVVQDSARARRDEVASRRSAEGLAGLARIDQLRATSHTQPRAPRRAAR